MLGPHKGAFSALSCTLFTHDCVAMYASNSIIKFVDDTTVVGLITNNDETAYREEVRLSPPGHAVYIESLTVEQRNFFYITELEN